ncbi:MAG: heterodisulfide reductase [Peptococcaceae bacterium BICA1-7]|nr:MAG: heterodisulfide reductase [Peptococcaceae bacterium BICA1-7]HBV96395.1 heterodisulfide reductase [Desulfotomaculum sp.]
MKVGFFIGCNTAFNRPDLEQAVRFSYPHLGVEIDDLEGQSCCPSWGTMPSVDLAGWSAVSARNFCLAEEKDLDIVTVCGSCYGSLAETRHSLQKDPDLREKVNGILEGLGRNYRGSANVYQSVGYLYKKIDIDKVRQSLKYSLAGLKVALQPGCHTLWPSKIYVDREEDSFHPHILKDMCQALGADVADYSRMTDCCGMGGMRSADMERSFNLLNVKLKSIKEEADPDLIVTGCSSCLIQIDTAQGQLYKDGKIKFQIPVLHYMQLLALCLGGEPEKVAGLAKTSVSGVINKIRGDSNV